MDSAVTTNTLAQVRSRARAAHDFISLSNFREQFYFSDVLNLFITNDAIEPVMELNVKNLTGNLTKVYENKFTFFDTQRFL